MSTDLTTTLAAYAVTSHGYGDTELVIAEQTREDGMVIGEGDPIARTPLDLHDSEAGQYISSEDVDLLADLDGLLAGLGYRRVSEWTDSPTGADCLVERV